MRNGNTKRPMIHRLFGTTNSSWSGAVRSCTNSRQVSWLKDLRPPPPSQSNASVAGARSTRAAGSLITVTRSCGICTRFPFNVPAAAKPCGGTHLLFLFSSQRSIAQYREKRKSGIKQAPDPTRNSCKTGGLLCWSRIRDSNPPPTAWEAVALPDELTLHTALSL